jgi:lysophospholipase L1-like esterase
MPSPADDQAAMVSPLTGSSAKFRRADRIGCTLAIALPRNWLRGLLLLLMLLANVLLLLPSGLAQPCSVVSGRTGTTEPSPRPLLLAQREQQVERALLARSYEAIAIGDSLVQRWPADLMTKALGTSALNAGFGGDRTENLLWRLNTFQWGRQAPDYALIWIGTNNVSHAPPCDVLRGILAVVNRVKKIFPRAMIVVIGLLPRRPDLAALNDAISRVNENLRNLSRQSDFAFLDVFNAFLYGAWPDGDLFLSDHLHLSRRGYILLTDSLANLITSTGDVAHPN